MSKCFGGGGADFDYDWRFPSGMKQDYDGNPACIFVSCTFLEMRLNVDVDRLFLIPLRDSTRPK